LQIINKLHTADSIKPDRKDDIQKLIQDAKEFEMNSLKDIPNRPIQKEKLAHYILYNLGKYMLENND